jgi:hypothetical protein
MESIFRPLNIADVFYTEIVRGIHYGNASFDGIYVKSLIDVVRKEHEYMEAS